MKKIKGVLVCLVCCCSIVFAAERVYNPENMMANNGDAELGNFDNWATEGGGVSIASDSATTGSYSFELVIDNNDNENGLRYGFSTGITAANEPMMIRFKYKTLAGTSIGPGGLRVQPRFFEGTNWKGEESIDLYTTNGQWVTVEHEFNVGSNISINRLDLRVTFSAFGSAVGTVRFDDFEIYNAKFYNIFKNIITEGADAENSNVGIGVFGGGWYGSIIGDAYTGVTDADSAGTGTKCFFMDNTADIYDRMDFRCKTYWVVPGQPMKLKFWYKTLSGFNLLEPAGLRLQARFHDRGSWKSEVNYDLPVTDGQWVQRELTFNVGSDPNINQIDITVKMNDFGVADGVAYFDEFELYEGKLPLVGEELLENGDFETGDFTAWTAANAGITSAQTNGGSYALAAVANTVSQTVSDSFAVVEGEHLLMRADYKIDSNDTADLNDASVSVRFFDGSSSLISEVVSEANNVNGFWVNIIKLIEVPDLAVSAEVSVDVNAAVVVYFDNISVCKEKAAKFNLINNHFINGDAEQGVSGPGWYYGGTATINTVDEASNCFQMNSTGVSGDKSDIRSRGYKYFVPGEKLLLTFRYKTLSDFVLATPGGFKLQARFYYTPPTGSRTWRGENDYYLESTNNQWVTKTYEFIQATDPCSNTLDFRATLNDFGTASGTVRFDDFKWYRKDCRQFPGIESLTNGGFETGNLTGWYNTSNVSVSGSEAYEGSYSLQCSTAGVSTVSGRVNVDGNANLYYSTKVKPSSGTTSCTATLKVRLYGWLGSLISETSIVESTLMAGQWNNVGGICTVPEEATSAEIVIEVDSDQTAYVDAVSLEENICACNGYDIFQLHQMAEEWLLNDFLPLNPDNDLDNFESYANQAALETKWGIGSGSYPSTGSSVITLLTNSGDAHDGSKALRWEYDNSVDVGRIFSDFNRTLSPSINLADYDEMRIWVNRHSGNSQEELFYVKFYKNTIAEPNIVAEARLSAANGSTYSPVGWSELVIDFNTLIFQNGVTNKAGLTNIVGFFFGTVGDAVMSTGGGTGTIDFDDIRFVDTIHGCGDTITMFTDLNSDCTVNFEDMAALGEYWLGSN